MFLHLAGQNIVELSTVMLNIQLENMKKLNVEVFYFLSELVFACICHPETKHGADKSEL